MSQAHESFERPVFADSLQPLGALTMELPPNCILVDNPTILSQTITELYSLPKTLTPSLYVDLEGIDLCRNGSISIIQVYASPTSKTYLIDVFTMGALAFSTPSTNGLTLKSLLEDASIMKAFYDCRNDNDALWNLYQIDTAGVHDIQLMELATRTSGNRRTILGLAKAINDHAGLSYQEARVWNDAKTRGKTLFAPERGGDWSIFERRPIPRDLIDYCVQDVAILPRLWNVFNARLMSAPNWRAKVEVETLKRLQSAKLSTFSNGREKALGPW